MIGIDPVLNADLLYTLRAMGHGDTLAVVDANYPATTTAHYTLRGEPIILDGVDAPRAIAAILSVMPIDTFVPDPVARMEVVGDPSARPEVQREVQAIVDRAFGKPLPLAGIERDGVLPKGARGVRRRRDQRAPALRLLPVEKGRSAAIGASLRRGRVGRELNGGFQHSSGGAGVGPIATLLNPQDLRPSAEFARRAGIDSRRALRPLRLHGFFRLLASLESPPRRSPLAAVRRDGGGASAGEAAHSG